MKTLKIALKSMCVTAVAALVLSVALPRPSRTASAPVATAVPMQIADNGQETHGHKA